MSGFKINVAGVAETSSSLAGRNSSFGDSVGQLYSTINTARDNAWQGSDAEMYYGRIMSYKSKLDEISEALKYWEQKTARIAANFEDASKTIQSKINELN